MRIGAIGGILWACMWAPVLLADDLTIGAQLHSESGEPVLTWHSPNSPGIHHFDIHRSDGLTIRGLGSSERTFFDMRTFVGREYTYRVEAIDGRGSRIAISDEVTITSDRRAFTIEGKMPMILGWADSGQDVAFDLHMNLLLRGPMMKPMRNGQRLYRMTRWDDIGHSLPQPASGREQTIRDIVSDPWHVGWDIYDESDDAIGERRKYDEIRALDLNTPIMGNVMPQHSRGSMAAVQEIFSIEHYSQQANWPSVTVPAAIRAMERRHGNVATPLIPIRQLWMCFDVYSIASARQPTAFLRHSVFSAMGYGAKGLYFFNDPGPNGFLDGPGIQLMRKNREMLGIIGVEVEAWGRHLLYSQFECEASTNTRLVSMPMSENRWWRDIVHVAYPEAVGKKVPAVQAAVQKHPRGHFLFVLPNMEIDYFAEAVRATVPRGLHENARAYRLSAGLPQVSIVRDGPGFTVNCGAVYAGAAYLITEDTAFADQIRADLEAVANEIRQRSRRLAEWDLEDARFFLDQCDESPVQSRLIAQIEPIHARLGSDPLAEQVRAERLFRAALAADLRGEPMSGSRNAAFRVAQPADEKDGGADENLALASKGAKARATMMNWVFSAVADQNNSPHLAIDGRLEPPVDLPWGGMNTAWVFNRNPVEPYPVLTIEMPREEEIGEIRMKQIPQVDSNLPGITRLAVEFVEDNSVEFFDLGSCEGMASLQFPARKTRTLRLVPLRYAPNAVSHGIIECQIYHGEDSPESFTPTAIRRVHLDIDWTTFGW